MDSLTPHAGAPDHSLVRARLINDLTTELNECWCRQVEFTRDRCTSMENALVRLTPHPRAA